MYYNILHYIKLIYTLKMKKLEFLHIFKIYIYIYILMRYIYFKNYR